MFAGGEETSIEGDEDGVPALRGRECGEEDGSPQAFAATLDPPFTGVLAAVEVEGSDADEGGGLAPAHPAELGHAHDEGDGGDHADAGDALQERQAAGEIVVFCEPKEQAPELLVAPLAQPLDLGFDEAAQHLVGEAVEPGVQPGDVFADLFDQGQMLGKGGEPLVGGFAVTD
jgi:hypothetical protein